MDATAQPTVIPPDGTAVSDTAPCGFAWRGVSVIAAVSFAVLLGSSTRYGFFGDELYFRAAGSRLDVGFADQGPMLPLLARIGESIAPDSLLVLRLPSVLATVAAIVIAALIARELGGGRGPQVVTALAIATSPFLLGQGVNLSTNSIDTVLWTAVTWLVVRWVRTRSDRLLLVAALLTAVDLQVKWLIPILWLSLGAAVLVVGPRDLLRRRALWAGAATAVVTTLPGLWWQARHGWPQLAMSGIIGAEQDMIAGRWTFVPIALLCAGLLGAVLLVYGTWRLLRSPELRAYRFLGLTVVLVFVAFVVTNGRPYYVVGVYAVAIAAGAVELGRRDLRPAARRTVAGLAVVSAVLTALSLPWQPARDVPAVGSDVLSTAAGLSVNGKFGWPELAAGVDEAFRALPPQLVEDTVVISDSYWIASAVDRLGTEPIAVYGTGRGFWYFGTPPETTRAALYVGDEPPTGFGSVRRVGSVDVRQGLPGETRGIGIWLVEDLEGTWADYWAANNDLAR